MRVRFCCAVAGAIFLLVLVTAAWTIPFHAAVTVDMTDRLLTSASWEHPLGTDALGRDSLIRLLVGARFSLLWALVATVCAFIIGWPLGILFRRAPIWLQYLPKSLAYISFIDPKSQLSPRWPSRALLGLLLAGGIAPVYLIWMVTVAILLPAGMPLLAVACGATLAPAVIHAMLRPQLSDATFPASTPQTDWALAALIFSIALMAQMYLDFAGLGPQPPIPSWGGILADYREYHGVWWRPVAVVYVITALTSASLLVIADEIVARLSSRKARLETA